MPRLNEPQPGPVRQRVAGAIAAAIALIALTASVHAQATQRPRLAPLDGTGVIPYFIAEGDEGSAYRPGDAELAAWALREWEHHAAGALRFLPAGEMESSSIRFRWLRWAADAELGRMEPSVANRRAIASLLIRPDETNFRPSIRRRVREDPLMRDVVLYYVCLHEIGHALGLGHSSNVRDVMWSGGSGVTLPIYDRYRKRLRGRDDIPQTSWLSPADIARLGALWGPDGLPHSTR
jgi:hypothetical protein